MQSKTSPGKKQHALKKNPLEMLKTLGSSVTRDSSSDIKNIGGGILDQLLGDLPEESGVQSRREYPAERREEPRERLKLRKEFSLFRYNEYHENEVVKRQIQELTEQIKREMEVFKKENASLLTEVKDAEKLTIEELPEKPGIYHIRFLEIILSIIRTLRMKIGESNTWLQAMISRKKKRGSLFMSLSKKKGTQYSLSQELQSARSVQ